MSDAEPTILIQQADWCCATWQNVFCLDWRGPTNVTRARLVVEAFEAFAGRESGNLALMTIVNPEAPPPESDARPIFAKTMRAASARICGSSYYVPIDGFKGAAVRGAITTLSLMALQSFPTRVFSVIPDASGWLAGRIDPQRKATLAKGIEAVVVKLQTLVR